jgi:hypothetical protein
MKGDIFVINYHDKNDIIGCVVLKQNETSMQVYGKVKKGENVPNASRDAY